MNWNVATLEQCRDFLARCKGWTKHLSHWHDDREGMEGLAHVQHSDHPIPATLDIIAASLPDGWKWLELNDNRSPGGSPRFPWSCRVVRHDMYNDKAPFSWADTELLARARCACLAWEASKK